VHLEALKAGMQGLPRRSPTAAAAQAAALRPRLVGSVLVGGGLLRHRLVEAALGGRRTLRHRPCTAAAYAVALMWAARLPRAALEDPNANGASAARDLAHAAGRAALPAPVVVLIWCLMVEQLSPALSAFWATLFMMLR
jgi:TRAP-type uncharacterized transport system fused permease subunit